MGIVSWLLHKFNGSTELYGEDVDAACEQYACETHIREVAFWSSVNIIANAVSKCEIKTYIRGKEIKGAEYYLWNIEPNINQNSSEFMHKLIAQLYRRNEVLVIENAGQLFVADDYNMKPYALYDDVFEGVRVKDFTFAKQFRQSEVIHLKLSEKDMRQVTSSLYASYSKLIRYTMKAYQKSRGTKGIFDYETLPVAGTDERRIFDELINEKFKKYMDSSDAVLPLGKGQSFTEIQSKTYSSESTRDIRAMIDDISDFTAKSFGIPPVLLRGDVQDVSKAIDQLLTFCIDPLVDMLQEEINRKRIGQDDYLNGTKTVIDTTKIKHIDILSVSTAIDKLVSSGCFCVNDIRIILGQEPLDEEWANRYFMTKNYSTVEELVKDMMKEGEE